MSDSFADLVKQDTPRLVIIYGRGRDNVEKFEYTVVGGLPTLSLVGAISRAQIKLLTNDENLKHCPESALVIAWDAERKEFHYFVDPTIPEEPLAGYMELVKAGVAASLLAKSQMKPTLLGPDGRPMRG